MPGECFPGLPTYHLFLQLFYIFEIYVEVYPIVPRSIPDIAS